MKINEPVTQREIPYPTGKMLVSKTDLRGVITYANQDFIDISGFSETELIGSSHNMVRHPDMPVEAFEDLWGTVKSGKPWVGLVKNRAKNGDHYWVKANVTPVLRDGQIVGYMSVRQAPSRDEVSQAETLYRDLKQGKGKLHLKSLGQRLNLINNLPLGGKFGVLIVALLLPILMLLYMLTAEQNKAIDFAAKEILGVEYLQPVRVLQQNTAKHRGLSNMLRNGDNVSGELSKVKNQLESALREVDAAQAKLGGTLTGADEHLDRIKALWQQIQTAGAGVSAPELFQLHTTMIKEIQGLMVHIGDVSNLILDPDLDSYYLMDVVVMRLPETLEDLGVLRGKSAGLLARGNISDVEELTLKVMWERARDAGDNALRSVKTAFEYNPDLVAELGKARDQFNDEMTAFYALVQRMLAGELDAADSGRLFAAGSQAIKAGFSLYDQTGPSLDRLLKKRIEGFQQNRLSGLIAVFVVVVIALWISWSIVRNITRPVADLSSALRSISEGDFSRDIPGGSRDEIGQALSTAKAMQIRLGFDIQDAKERAAATMRIKVALDSVGTNVMVADPNRNIIYLNRAAQSLFNGLQTDIRKELPEFNATTLLGANIDQFHKQPGHQQRLLEGLTTTHSSQLEIGGRTVRIVANPVLDSEGNRLGTAVEWTDLTADLAREAQEQQRIAEERRIGAENQRIRVALDNANSNVMVANNDRQIIYINKNALDLFQRLEQDIRRDLPNFSADRLLGSNIDEFHKNPNHQMQLLGGLRQSHTSQIEIGGHTMQIIATPVVDDNGNRLGTAVDWTDRTDEVAVERELDELVEAASSGKLDKRLNTAGKRGFFLQLSQGFNRLLDQLTSVFEDIADVMSHMADGDLTRSIDNDYQGTFGTVKQDINRTVSNIEGIIAKLRDISDQVGNASDEISSGNNNLSARTEQQAASLQETAASMEQLTSTVRNNADNAQQANQVASSARQQAEKGGQVVSSAIDAMKQINSSSDKISEIIGVIDEIAFQTNLLALNASVEAARAGEQGRGFAVVATEVRNLASRSAAAAKEIKELIQDSGEKVRMGSALVNESGDTLQEIVTNVKKVGDIIAEIAAASAQQSAGIDQVNQAVTSLDEMTQQNAALAEEISASSAAMSDNAREMREAMAFFQVRQQDD